MRVVTQATGVEVHSNYCQIATDAGIALRLYFLTPYIIRMRASFDGKFLEASYSLVMTAWDSITDEVLGAARQRVTCDQPQLFETPQCFTLVGSALKVITLGLLNPVFLVWKTTYIYNRIIVDGRRLHFDGEPMGLLAHYVIWALLRIVTFGIYGLFVHIRMKKWVASHVSIEDGYAQVKVI